MGKAKNKRLKFERPKPTGLMSVQEAENELERQASPSSGMVQSLLEELNGPSEEGRECSCTTIANLVSQPNAVKLLLQHNIVKILSPVILDKNPEIQIKALGALRNLSVDGGETVCQEMVKKDILTPLLSLLKQYGCNWTPEKPSRGKKQQNLKSSIYTEAVHILWNLCESCDEALEVFNRENLFPAMYTCMQHLTYGVDLAVTVANCLYTVTEDNAPVIKMCQDPEVLGLLNSLISLSSDSSDLILLKTLATGIMVNIYSGKLPTVGSSVIMSVLKSVSDVLVLDGVEVAQKMAGECVLQNGDNGTVSDEESGKPHQLDINQEEIDNKFRDVQNILSAQQVALEIVANVCCSDDGGWEDMDSSESSSCDDDTVAEEAMEQDTIDMFSSLCVSTEVQQAVKQFSVFEKVCLKCSSADWGSLPKRLTKSLVGLQTHALLCMNNMVNSLDLDLLGGIDRLHQVWTSLASIITNSKSDQGNEVLLDSATSALRAVIQKLSSNESPKLLEVSASDLHFLFDLGRSCQLADIKVNVIRIIAAVGVAFSKQKSLPNVDILKNIGIFLLTVVCGDKDLWVVSEALDCVFDVFGEDHLDPVDLEIGLTARLSKVIPDMKARVSAAKKKPDVHYPVITTARTNLIGFVKYKLSKRKS